MNQPPHPPSHNAADASVDRLLRALGHAELPPGLEGRISQRLAQSPTPPAPQTFGWRELFTASTGARVWRQGVLTGAVAALLTVAAALLAARAFHPSASPASIAHTTQTAPPAPAAVPVGTTPAKPCPGTSPPLLVAGTSRSPRPETVRRDAVLPPSARLREPALTAEERGLLKLARIGDPGQLASLNPELRARMDAEDAAQVQAFFAKPKPTTDPNLTPPAAESLSQPTPDPTPGTTLPPPGDPQ